VGTNEQNMAIAAHKLIEMQGGQVVILDGKNIGSVPLPIGGLMSCESAEKVAKQATTVLDGFKRCGCNLNNPNMQLSLLALVVIPELRLSDLGLVDVKNLQFLPVIEQ
ncbi:MAG: adenine deaminase, partial [Anaerolineales bacterium]|nr:adenine deaminase [Anaerolineales bacterium]